LVEVFIDAPQQIRRNLENLLKAIETGLPLSSLYLDLNSEKPVENDMDTTIQDVETVLQGLLDMVSTSAMKEALLERLAVSEPFVNYPKLIDKYKTGGTTNGRD